MKKLLILLLASVLLCGCARVQGKDVSPEDTTDTTANSHELDELDNNGGMRSYQNIDYICAVAVTWGSKADDVAPFTASSGLYGEERQYDYVPVRVSFDDVFTNTFDKAMLNRFSESDCHKNGYLFLPEKVCDEIHPGEKQLIFIRNVENGFGLKVLYDFVEEFPMFDIVDGRIAVTDGDMSHLKKNEAAWDPFVYMIYANDLIRIYSETAPIFENGMLLSDFPGYVDKVNECYIRMYGD